MNENPILGTHKIDERLFKLLMEYFKKTNIIVNVIKDIDILHSKKYAMDFTPEILLVNFDRLKTTEIEYLFKTINNRKIVVINTGKDPSLFNDGIFQLSYDGEENTTISNSILTIISRAVSKIKNIMSLSPKPNADEIEFLKKLSREQYIDLMVFMMAIIETKDNYTKTHCERTAVYAHHLANALDFDIDEKLFVGEVGLVHDIGKIAIPKKILTKSGRLTSDEFEIVKRHTNITNNLLPSRLFGDMKDIARSHHERYDGKGYPDGLRGEEIPCSARIIAVADSFDAMTSNRSYNQIMTLEEAQKEIIRCSGTQFDPHIAKTFSELIAQSDEIKDYFEKQRAIVKTKTIIK